MFFTFSLPANFYVLPRLIISHEEESTRLQKEKEEELLQKNQMIKSEKLINRKLEIKKRDLDRDFKRVNEDLNSAQTDLKKQGDELKSVRHAYREKLSSLLSVHEEGKSPVQPLSVRTDFTESHENDEKNEKNDKNDPLSDLLSSFKLNEEKLIQNLSISNQQNVKLKNEIQGLSDNYRKCLDALEEVESRGEIFLRHNGDQIIFFDFFFMT